MKHLILLRHAKSSWANPELNDFDRPLNKRGKRSASALGQWLRNSIWQPDVVLCSSARRTRETCERLDLGMEPQLRDDLYHASAGEMLHILRGQEANVVMMIAHNPGTAELAHMLVLERPAHARFADYPTGALLVAGFPVRSWSKVGAGSGDALSFLTPHDLSNHTP